MATERCTVRERSQPLLAGFDSLKLWQDNKSKSLLKRGTDFLKIFRVLQNVTFKWAVQ